MGEDTLVLSGRLLLPGSPSAAVASAPAGEPLVFTLLVAISVILLILLARPFLELLPSLADSIFRARGSTALENSVRQSRDRSLIALALLLPLLLLAYRYRLYDPQWVRDLSPSLRLGAIAAVLAGWLILRQLLYVWLRPRRRYDFYSLAHRSGYTFFILLMMLMILTAGILAIFGSNDFTVRSFLYIEMAVLYLLFLIRRSQILSLSCSHLLSFLYLCALDLIPTGLLIVSAAVL